MKKMSAHLFFPSTPPDLGLPPAPAASLLPFLPCPPFWPPPFFVACFTPSGDVAFDRRPLRVCRPWDRVDGIMVVVLWGCSCCGGCWLCESFVVGRRGCWEEVGCGNIRSQPFLVWLMWRGGKAVGILVAEFHALTWRDSATVWRGTFTTSEVIDEVGGSIHGGHTFFK